MLKKNRVPLIYISLAIVTFISFWNVTRAAFVNYDDPKYVTGNIHIQQGITPQAVRWAFTTFYNANWHPVTWISHMLDFQLFGLNPAGAHTVNLLFHIANTMLLFFVFHRMTKSVWRSAFVAALFALHPLHVQSVAWASERKDVLSAFFWMLAMIAYVRYAERPVLKRYLPVILFFVFGLMAKPMLVTLPLVLLLLDYWPLQRFQCGYVRTGSKWRIMRSLILEKIPLFLFSALSGIVTYIAQRKGGAVQSLGLKPLSIRIPNAIFSYLAYMQKMFWPENLAVFYPYPKSFPALEVAGAGLVLCGITMTVLLLAFRNSERHGYLALGWFWYLITLLPVIGIVQVGGQAMADRYTYIPLTGLFIMVAWGIPELLQRWRVRGNALFAPGVLALACLSIVTWRQTGYWQNSITLFGHALKVTDDNYIAYANYGNAYEALGDYRKAIGYYDKAIEISPGFVEALFNCGNAYGHLGDYGRAIDYYGKTINAAPEYFKAYFNRGYAYAALGNYSQAIVDFKSAAGLNPGNGEAYFAMAVAYKRMGGSANALSAIKKAAKLGNKPAREFLKKYGIN